MKIILYMAVSANGLIAKSNDDTSWISKEEWASYGLAVRTAGNVVMGHRTYGIITKQPEFSEFKDVKVVVVSKQDFPTLSPNHRIAHSPMEALQLLNDFKTIIVAGGSILNTSFLAENLIDEIYIDIEPILLGKGLPLFSEINSDIQLKLLGSKPISDNEIQLHYQVIKM